MPALSPAAHRASPHLVLRALLGVVLVLGLTACAGGDEQVSVAGDGEDEQADTGDSADADAGQSDAPDDEPTETTAPGLDASGAGEVAGVLGGSDIEGGCVWLDADDGTRYELVTGTTSTVRIDPSNQLLVSDQGEVIAQSGDRVVIDGKVDEGLMTFCQVGTNFVVEDARAE